MSSQTKTQKVPDIGRMVLRWTAPEFREIERGKLWITTAGVSSLLLVAFAIWQNTYTFAVVILLLGGIYFLTHNKKPREIPISLTTNGIMRGSEFFPYLDIETFWILFLPQDDIKTLHFVTRSGMIREHNIELEDQEIGEISHFLGGHISEWEGRTEKTVEKWIRILKL